MNLRAAASLGLVFFTASVSEVLADPIVLTTNGLSGTYAVSGTATIDVDNTTRQLKIKLENTTTQVDRIAEVLDGFAFTLAGIFSGLTLQNVTATGFVDCTGVTGCQSTGVFRDYNPNGTYTTLDSPYTWGLVGSQLVAGAANGGTPYKPSGILNASSLGVTSNGNGGLVNDVHNDYLMGPVTFTLGYTGRIDGVTAATFYWGTGPNATSVPEPSSLLLLGAAAAGLLGTLRLRLKKG